MTNLVNLDETRLYIGTFKKYNEGSLFGKWFDLNDYSDFDQLHNAILLLHKDEISPEIMVQDWECNPLFERMGLISESHISSEIYNVISAIENSDYNIEILESFSDCFGCYKSIDEIIEKVSENYMGEYTSDIDFVENLLSDTGSIPQDLPSYIYIDWNRTTNDIMFDYSTSNGYYFSNF